MDLTSVFAWFAQESISIAEQANEPERRETFTHLALLWPRFEPVYKSHESFLPHFLR